MAWRMSACFVLIFFFVSCGKNSTSSTSLSFSVQEQGVEKTVLPEGKGKSPFVSLWQTTRDNETITLPLREGFDYDFRVNWGDGNTSVVSSHDDSDRVHTYKKAGKYTVAIEGVVSAWFFNNGGDKDKILKVLNLGDVGWKNLERAFYGCSRLTTFRGGRVSSVRDMAYMLAGARKANPSLDNWDFSGIRESSGLFRSFIGVSFSTANYSHLLDRLNATVSRNVKSSLFFPETAYFWQAFTARLSLKRKGWRITDSGIAKFISVWKTTRNGETITLPLREGFEYNFIVDWGDRSRSLITSHDDEDRTHRYAKAGEYTVAMIGKLESWFFNNSGDKDKIMKVVNLSDMGWKNLSKAFYGCSYLTEVKGGNVPDVTDLSWMFAQAPRVNPSVGHWNTSAVERMDWMFWNAFAARPSVEKWDTSSVVHMDGMFSGAISANPSVGQWDTSSVKGMSYMFAHNPSANPSVDRWDTSSVTDMTALFLEATSANPSVDHWDTSSVEDMGHLFYGATSASPSVKGWDFSGIATQAGLHNSFNGANFSTQSYSSLLERLDASLHHSFAGRLSLPSVNHLRAVSAARDNLVSRGWVIEDQGAEKFISRWMISSANETITLPLREGFKYDFSVDWGDGTTGHITSYDDADRIHAYREPGTYTISIDGIVEAWSLKDSSDKGKILEVVNLGDVGWKNLEGAFAHCYRLRGFEGGNVSGVTSMARMFEVSTTVRPSTGHWDTSSVTDMSFLFSSTKLANPDVSQWDTSSVTDMSHLFYGTTSAQPDVSGWDTSSVKNMSFMFAHTVGLNPDVSQWDTSSVTNMKGLFAYSRGGLDPDVSRWDTSSVTDMSQMFFFVEGAQPDVSEWDTSSVKNMYRAFAYTEDMDPSVGNWDTSSVTNMEGMFASTGAANPDVSKWDTSSVVNMMAMFSRAKSANPSVARWKTSSVANMNSIFYKAESANPSMAHWDFSALPDSDALRYAFYGANFSIDNYSHLLIRLNATLAESITGTLTFPSLHYNSRAAAARAGLVATGWDITDGGVVPETL